MKASAQVALAVSASRVIRSFFFIFLPRSFIFGQKIRATVKVARITYPNSRQTIILIANGINPIITQNIGYNYAYTFCAMMRYHM